MRKHLIILSTFLFAIFVAITGCNTSQSETATESTKSETAELRKSNETKESIEKQAPPEDAKAPVMESTSTENTQSKEESTKQTNVKQSNGDSSSTNKTNQSSTSGKTATAPTKPTTTPKTEVKKEEKPVTQPPAKEPETKLVNVSIVIKGPSDIGTIVGNTSVSVEEGSTILDVLLSVAKKKGIQVDYTGKGALAYVQGIHNIYEFDYGPKSGWTCLKNGVTLDRSADAIQVNNGDHIEWIYKEDYTEE